MSDITTTNLTVSFQFNGCELGFRVFNNLGIPTATSFINDEPVLSLTIPNSEREQWAGNFFDSNIDSWWDESGAPVNEPGATPINLFLSQARAGFVFCVTTFTPST